MGNTTTTLSLGCSYICILPLIIHVAVAGNGSHDVEDSRLLNAHCETVATSASAVHASPSRPYFPHLRQAEGTELKCYNCLRFGLLKLQNLIHAPLA